MELCSIGVGHALKVLEPSDNTYAARLSLGRIYALAKQYRKWYCFAMKEKKRRTYRDQLFELALDQHGLITTADARELGIPAIELRKLAHRGKLRHISRGVYKFSNLVGLPDENYFRALLEVGPDAFLIQDSVLSFHGLASVNPRKIKKGTFNRVRRKIEPTIQVIHLPHSNLKIENRNGVRLTRVAQAILDSQNIVMRERLHDAVVEGIAMGLITKDEEKKLNVALVQDE
jgi:hypothetical protein